MLQAIQPGEEGTNTHYLNTPSMPAIYAAFICDEVERLGFDSQFIAEQADRSREELLLPGGLITPATFFNMVLEAMAISDTSDFGLTFGLSVETLPFRDALASGLSIRAALCAPNLHQAIERLTYFSSLESHIFVNQIEVVDSACRIKVIAPWIQASLVPALQRFYIEAYFRYFHEKIISFLSCKPSDLVLRFTHAKPPYFDSYDLFDAKIHFDAEENSYSIPENLMRAPNARYNRSTSALVVRQCEDALLSQPEHERKTWKSKVLTIVATTIEGRYPTQAEVAKMLNIGERTLARNLRHEKNGYQNIVDQHRFHRSKELLRDTQLKIESVAQELGFSDASNFRKAFKKWANRTPFEYRKLFQ